ncbi:hypothetical protein BH10ACI1_BH10ACI1_06750 [soil metagenome]
MALSSLFIGKKVKVIASDGTDLFTLNNSGTEEKVTVKDLYNIHKIQWFEPEADNYLPLTATNSHFGSSTKVKHFTWQQVADFAMVDRMMLSYRSGGNGDWKAATDGASGFVLVDVGGTPYWADGVGQIPFAVGSFKSELKDGNSEEGAIKATLLSAQKHSTGNIFPTDPVISNQYDDYFVLRGAIWASRKYDVTEDKISYREPELHRTITQTSRTIVDGKINPSANELGNPLPASVPRKYGLIK